MSEFMFYILNNSLMVFSFKILSSFFCSAGFSIMFNIPRKLIVNAGVVGAGGFLVYELTMTYQDDYILAFLFGSISIGILGEIFAFLKRSPSTVFTIPGIIPIVPGYSVYYTMLYLAQGESELATESFSKSAFGAIAIAAGIAISTSIMRRIRPILERKKVSK